MLDLLGQLQRADEEAHEHPVLDGPAAEPMFLELLDPLRDLVQLAPKRVHVRAGGEQREEEELRDHG